MSGRVHQVSISKGGVPKRPIDMAYATPAGLTGDGHNDTRFHGGPDRALCIFSLDVIDELRAEGHGIFPGAAGENITVRDVEWRLVVPGSRWGIGEEVTVEITNYTTPCQKNQAWFVGGEFGRMSQALHPGSSRVYARVVTPGSIRPGDQFSPAG